MQHFGLNKSKIPFISDKNPDKVGLRCLGSDIELIRLLSKKLKIFCPGIRNSEAKQDQKRTVSWAQFSKAADEKCFAVIGRPIYESGDPVQNIKKM